MLARAVETIAETTTLPGGSTWELKWDGYRAVLVVDDDGAARIYSGRRGLRPAAGRHRPGRRGRGVVDHHRRPGLLGAAAPRRQPAHPARLAREHPASYAAFDVLTHAGTDLRPRPLSERRAVLAELAGAWSAPMTLSPSTDDPAMAATWFRDLAVAGIEGLVAKGAAQPYRPGRRDWLKVKHRSTVDVVCAAVIGPITAPDAAVAGLPIDGELRIVGRTVPLDTMAARDLTARLRPAGSEHPWPAVVPASAVHGFGAGREPVTLTLVDPVVIEVSADIAWSGTSWRHAVRYIRAREDFDPAKVDLPPALARRP